MKTIEQRIRDALERMNVPDAQNYTAGDLVELANMVNGVVAAREGDEGVRGTVYVVRDSEGSAIDVHDREPDMTAYNAACTLHVYPSAPPTAITAEEAGREGKATLTDRQISAGGRELCNRAAEACEVDREDYWKVYGNEYIEDFRAAFLAAMKLPSAPAQSGGQG